MATRVVDRYRGGLPVAVLDVIDFTEHVRVYAGHLDLEWSTVMRIVALMAPRWAHIMRFFKREGPPLLLRFSHDDNKRVFFRLELPTDYPRIVRPHVEIPIRYEKLGRWEYRDEDERQKLIAKWREQQDGLKQQFVEQLVRALQDFYSTAAAQRMARWMSALLFTTRIVCVKWDLFTEGHSYA